jgi:hypothetical protein
MARCKKACTFRAFIRALNPLNHQTHPFILVATLELFDGMESFKTIPYLFA